MTRFFGRTLLLVAGGVLLAGGASAAAECDYMRDVRTKPKVQRDFLAHYRYARDLPLAFDGELGRKNRKLLAKYRVGGKELLLDKQTIRCLGCHDEMLSVGTDRAGREIVQKNFHALVGSHALGLDYLQKARSMPTVFLDPDPNRNNVIFIGGKLGCLSCHNPFSRQKYHLNAPGGSEDLCSQCHRR